ncbi:hypothetical protein H4582DRAFT_397992 [Lactarius indigo]|nr:hypothetical protein H4582DRAFT_397992 [Lactarius indigo]
MCSRIDRNSNTNMRNEKGVGHLVWYILFMPLAYHLKCVYFFKWGISAVLVRATNQKVWNTETDRASPSVSNVLDARVSNASMGHSKGHHHDILANQDGISPYQVQVRVVAGVTNGRWSSGSPVGPGFQAAALQWKTNNCSGWSRFRTVAIEYISVQLSD